MRNLKKILALVLALVMSLSLMAAAGASSFPDVDADNPYATAIDVLDGLKVFQGFEDGTFKPTDTLNRAQAAVLVYRIATGDVEGKQVENYSYMAQSKFVDLDGYNWAKGYINYCQNAGIVIGTDATHFNPGGKVTGYQLLVMLLRTLGYGKVGEFSDPKGWELQTAAIAKREGILKNITDGNLGAAAPRQLVAEILFQGLLTETVQYNYTVDGGYAKGETLGKKILGLEEVTGVVMANEYADLEDFDTLPSGKTRLDVDGTNYTLNVSTDLTDIGESRTAYVKKTTQNSFNLVVDQLFGNDNNVRAETGDETKVSTLAGTENLSLADAKYFVNFGEDELYNRSDYRISYVITSITRWTSNSNLTQADFVEELEDTYGIRVDTENDTIKRTGPDADDNYAWEWTVKKGDENRNRISIAPGNEITWQHRNCIQEIFYYAGLEKAGNVDEYGTVVLGEVYVGTQYTKDISDTISYNEFVETYLKTAANDQYFTSSDNGDWLKIIDNNGDGIAEYVFKTWYGLAEVTGYNKRGEYFTFSANGSEAHNGWVINVADGNVNYLGDYEPAIGDLVLAAWIDGQWQIEKAPMETRTIKTVSYKDKTVTTTEDDTWNQSDEQNWTVYLDQILEMNEKTEYEIFFDHFNHIRAYREVAGQTSYALLSELYYTNNFNGKFIKNNTPVVEITMGEEETVEMLANSNNKFSGVARNYSNVALRPVYDYLQTAISHLGYLPAVDANTAAVADNRVDASSDASLTTTAKGNGDEYTWTAADTVSQTNVAVYTLSDDGESVTVTPAAVQYVDRYGNEWYYSDTDVDGDGKQTTADKITKNDYLALPGKGAADLAKLTPVYSVDYVQLAIEDIKKGASAYTIDEADVSAWDRGNVTAPAEKASWKGNYVNAVHDTEYYIVGMGDGETLGSVTGIRYFTDYAELPAIDAKDIKAIYAVASNTTADVTERDYWVADVVVIETTGQVKNWDSVSLAYYNPLKTTGNVRDLYALDSQTEDPSVTLVPKDKPSWGGQYDKYWFYELYDTEVAEPSITAANIVKIEKDYDDHGIYAGRATRSVEVLGRGSYVMVDQGPTKEKDTRLVVGEVPVYGVIWDNTDTGRYPTYSLIELATSEIRSGDELIWVNDKNDNLKYVVISNISYSSHSGQLSRNEIAPAWLMTDLYDDIIDDQNPAAKVEKLDFTLNFADGDNKTYTLYDENGEVMKALTAADDTYTMDVTGKSQIPFQVVGDEAIGDISFSNGTWKLYVDNKSVDLKTWACRLVRIAPQTTALVDSGVVVDEVKLVITITTEEKVEEVVDAAKDVLLDPDASEADKTAAQEALDTFKGNGYADAANAAVGNTTKAVETAKDLVAKYSAWDVAAAGEAKTAAMDALVAAYGKYSNADAKPAVDAAIADDATLKAQVDAIHAKATTSGSPHALYTAIQAVATHVSAVNTAAATLTSIDNKGSAYDALKALTAGEKSYYTDTASAADVTTLTDNVTKINTACDTQFVALYDAAKALGDAAAALTAETGDGNDPVKVAALTAARNEKYDALTPAQITAIKASTAANTTVFGGAKAAITTIEDEATAAEEAKYARGTIALDGGASSFSDLGAFTKTDDVTFTSTVKVAYGTTVDADTVAGEFTVNTGSGVAAVDADDVTVNTTAKTITITVSDTDKTSTNYVITYTVVEATVSLAIGTPNNNATVTLNPGGASGTIVMNGKGDVDLSTAFTITSNATGASKVNTTTWKLDGKDLKTANKLTMADLPTDFTENDSLTLTLHVVAKGGTASSETAQGEADFTFTVKYQPA